MSESDRVREKRQVRRAVRRLRQELAGPERRSENAPGVRKLLEVMIAATQKPEDEQ